MQTDVTPSEKFELEVFEKVKEFFPDALHEVFIYRNIKNVSEVDIAVVHTSGIYLFEVKRRGSLIYGSPTHSYWRAICDSEVTWFLNPVKQTMTHINQLCKKYKISPTSCHAMVVFDDKSDISNVEYIDPRYTVCNFKDLPSYLESVLRNRETPISPFILEDIHYSLSRTSGNEKYRRMHANLINTAYGKRVKKYQNETEIR